MFIKIFGKKLPRLSSNIVMMSRAKLQMFWVSGPERSVSILPRDVNTGGKTQIFTNMYTDWHCSQIYSEKVVVFIRFVFHYLFHCTDNNKDPKVIKAEKGSLRDKCLAEDPIQDISSRYFPKCRLLFKSSQSLTLTFKIFLIPLTEFLTEPF